MNWEAIGAIAESFGAIGVIATLIYLAIQVRHSKEATDANTRQMRGEAFIHLSEGVSQQLSWLRSNLEDSDRVIRTFSNKNWEDISTEDQRLAMYWNLEEATYHELAFMLWHEGAIDEQAYLSREEYWLTQLLAPGRRYWWDNYVYLLDERFISRINTQLAQLDNLGPEDLRRRFPMYLPEEN